MLANYINEKIKEVHENNVRVGWWTDIKTGESIIETRNRPEVLALVHSELSEAAFGYAYAANDDHLTERPMAEVELADAAIRLFDILGAEGFYVGEDIDFLWSYDPEEHFWSSLTSIHNAVSYALEGYRKGNAHKYRLGLTVSLMRCFSVAGNYGYDIKGAIEEKLEYNKNRADHKLENRLKDDGKKI